MDTIATLTDALKNLDMIAKFLRIMAKAGVTIEHIKMLINDRTARANMVAYLQAGCPKLENAAVAVKAAQSNFLKPIGRTKVSGQATRFDPHAFFKTGSGLYVRDSFEKYVLRFAKPISGSPDITLDQFQLAKNATDQQIRNELPEGYVFRDPSQFCALIAKLIRQQRDGEAGILLNNGYANIFYVEVGGVVRAVRVYWGSVYREWDFSAGGFVDGQWLGGYRVFSAATAA